MKATKPVVLGRGELHLRITGPGTRPTQAEVWYPGILVQKYLRGLSVVDKHGTLYFQPDPPPKRKGRGKRD